MYVIWICNELVAYVIRIIIHVIYVKLIFMHEMTRKSVLFVLDEIIAFLTTKEERNEEWMEGVRKEERVRNEGGWEEGKKKE